MSGVQATFGSLTTSPIRRNGSVSGTRAFNDLGKSVNIDWTTGKIIDISDEPKKEGQKLDYTEGY